MRRTGFGGLTGPAGHGSSGFVTNCVPLMPSLSNQPCINSCVVDESAAPICHNATYCFECLMSVCCNPTRELG